MKIKTLSPSQEKELLRKAQESTGVVKARYMQQIIYMNMNLVKYIITRYFNYSGVVYDELVPEGNRSLVKAIENFDLNSPNRFAVYAGFWVKQNLRSYIEKVKLLKVSAVNTSNIKDLLFFDESVYQNDDKKTYSLLDTLSSDSFEHNQSNIRQHDISKLINKIINMLENRDMILFIRLYYKILPTNCLDIYYMLNKEELKIFLEELKITTNKTMRKDLKTFLLEMPCKKKIKTSSIIKKYLDLFNSANNYKNNYKFGDISNIIGRSENYLRKIKQTSLAKLQDLIKDNLEYYNI